MLQETKNILAEFGWYEGRQVPDDVLTEWTDALARVGLQSFDAAIKIMKEFGGLHIRPRIRPGSKSMVGRIDFDPLLGGFGEEDRVEGWVEFLNQPAYPVGDAEYHLLIVAEDGKIYWNGSDMGCIGCFLGDTIYEAMETLLLGGKKLVFWEYET